MASQRQISELLLQFSIIGLPSTFSSCKHMRIWLVLVSLLFMAEVALLLPQSAQAGIGSCSTEEVRGLRDEGFTAKEIRELCRSESENESSRGSRRRSYDFDQNVAPPPRVLPAFRCGCYAGPVCPLMSPLPQGASCSCFSQFGSCPGQAF